VVSLTMAASNVRPSSTMPTASTSKAYHARLEELTNFRESLKDKDLKGIQELGRVMEGALKKLSVPSPEADQHESLRVIYVGGKEGQYHR